MNKSIKKLKYSFTILDPDRFFGKLFDKIFKIRKNNWYQITLNHIVKHPEQDSINIDEIKNWSIHNEMIFDLVKIQLKDDNILIWKDFHNDLIDILIKHANMKQIEERS